MSTDGRGPTAISRSHDRVGNAPRREERRTLVRSLMDGQRCADCGLAYPWYVMALDNGSGQNVDMLKRLANRKASMRRFWLRSESANRCA